MDCFDKYNIRKMGKNQVISNSKKGISEWISGLYRKNNLLKLLIDYDQNIFIISDSFLSPKLFENYTEVSTLNYIFGYCFIEKKYS